MTDHVFSRIESNLRDAGERPAVDDDGRALSYAELARWAGRLAALIRGHDGSNAGVGLLTGRGYGAVVGIVGILGASSYYVPLNDEFPSEKLEQIVEDAQLNVVVTAARGIDALQRLLGIASWRPRLVIYLGADSDSGLERVRELGVTCRALEDSTEDAADESAALSLGDLGSPERPALAYIMYTSGSTGKSKGVMVSRRAVAAFFDWCLRSFDLRRSDRVAAHSNLSFDLSVFDLLGCLAAGACYVPFVRANDLLVPARFLNARRVTVCLAVPSLLTQLKRLGHLNPGSLPGLRYFLFCGEELPLQMAQAVLAAAPNAAIFNLYGPTEATVACSSYRLGEQLQGLRSVPIGEPNELGGMLVVKTDSFDLAEPGEIGRLMLAGEQLAEGYWRRHDLSGQKFVTRRIGEVSRRYYDSGDLALRDALGRYFWCGRSDFQVKIRGYRVELGEIENCLLSFSSVQATCAVLAKGEEPRIIAYVVADHFQGEEAELAQRLKQHCEERLPSYMVPSRYMRLPELELNANGKTDRVLYSEHATRLETRRAAT